LHSTNLRFTVALHGFDAAEGAYLIFGETNTQQMRCRLLYLVGQLRAGGLERQLYYLLRSIDRKQYTPALAVWSFRGDEFYLDQLRDLDIAVHFLSPGTSRPSKLRWFRSLAKQLNPEVIHSYSLHTNIAAWYAAAGTGAVAIGSVRSDFTRAVTEVGFILGRLCARWPRVQIFNNLTAAHAARSSYSPFTPQRVFVIRNSTDLERFTNTPLPDANPATLVAIGSLTRVKRWDRLISAAGELKKRHIPFRLRMVGDGPLRAPLEQHAHELGIDDRVEFVGQQNDVPALLADALLLVHTSQSEGCPNVIMEAMACGRPVVATDAGDIPSLVDDGKTGFVVAQDDADALAGRIGALINDRVLCERMSVAARLKAEKEFSLKRLLGETFAAYRSAGWRDESEVLVTNENISNEEQGIRRITLNG
jgi:glycosyltransferase involved in cell wall biosynthesis